jgi:hypothetical protein
MSGHNSSIAKAARHHLGFIKHNTPPINLVPAAAAAAETAAAAALVAAAIKQTGQPDGYKGCMSQPIITAEIRQVAAPENSSIWHARACQVTCYNPHLQQR